MPLLLPNKTTIKYQSFNDKITSSMQSWATTSLSFSGRCQVINSVLFSMQCHCANIFVLPKSIIKKVESVCRAVLKSQKENSRIMAHVSWEKVCLPKKYDGLGVKNCDICQKNSRIMAHGSESVKKLNK